MTKTHEDADREHRLAWQYRPLSLHTVHGRAELFDRLESMRVGDSGQFYGLNVRRIHADLFEWNFWIRNGATLFPGKVVNIVEMHQTIVERFTELDEQVTRRTKKSRKSPRKKARTKR